MFWRNYVKQNRMLKKELYNVKNERNYETDEADPKCLMQNVNRKSLFMNII